MCIKHRRILRRVIAPCSNVLQIAINSVRGTAIIGNLWFSEINNNKNCFGNPWEFLLPPLAVLLHSIDPFKNTGTQGAKILLLDLCSCSLCVFYRSELCCMLCCVVLAELLLEASICHEMCCCFKTTDFTEVAIVSPCPVLLGCVGSNFLDSCFPGDTSKN